MAYALLEKLEEESMCFFIEAAASHGIIMEGSNIHNIWWHFYFLEILDFAYGCLSYLSKSSQPVCQK